ncbi:HpcH/HpaI aldolase/citrate lyase family protein [Agilicoccus flavus]|uniref:HpcH/HpaI aldolase/citrate lyase family protein n=1 Tax=Agilicoccus flavus TaxID=2775968 RepID=UPI0027DA3C5B|nr:CoA ester lyase [Agilicoccus flavus]
MQTRTGADADDTDRRRDEDVAGRGEVRPRRSVLYLPASNPRAMEKAKGLACDALVLDLEDAVAPDAKEQARAAAVAAVSSGAWRDEGRREVTVRVNAAGTPWHDDDLAAVGAAGPDAVVVPKVTGAAAVREVLAALDAAGAPASTAMWAMLETPGAVLRAEEIAAASDRLTVLVVGTNDLAKELRVDAGPRRVPLLTSLGLAVLGARAAGKVVLDGVYNDIRDAEGFDAECAQGRELGFDGKTLVHPSQIDGANTVFAPDAASLEDARAVLRAWEAGGGRGVVTHEGRMIEALHVETARRLLRTDSAIRARSSTGPVPDEPGRAGAEGSARMNP